MGLPDNLKYEKHDNLGNIFFGKPYSRKNLIMLMDAIRDDTIDDLIAFDNQRKADFHPVTTFKRVWDKTINYYESKVHDYDEYSRQEIAGLDIPLYQKVAIYKHRDGESFRDVAHNPTLRKKLAIDVRDEILSDLVSEAIEVDVYPTMSGYAIIPSQKFDTRELLVKYANVELKKDPHVFLGYSIKEGGDKHE